MVHAKSLLDFAAFWATIALDQTPDQAWTTLAIGVLGGHLPGLSKDFPL